MNALEHFAELEDPRSDHALHYPLASLIFLTLAAVVAMGWCASITEVTVTLKPAQASQARFFL